jgi:hypothetical protein
MSPTDLLQRQRAKPFQPFAVVVGGGARYAIRAPDQLMVGPPFVVIGLKDDPQQPYFNGSVDFDLAHVVGLEALPEE